MHLHLNTVSLTAFFQTSTKSVFFFTEPYLMIMLCIYIYIYMLIMLIRMMIMIMITVMTIIIIRRLAVRERLAGRRHPGRRLAGPGGSGTNNDNDNKHNSNGSDIIVMIT